MNCADLEILICDYVDGTLAPDRKADVERHLAECPACAELARDSAAAVRFMDHAADVEPPPELITRILFDAPWSKGKAKSKVRIWMTAILSPFLQPKYAMGMAMTILSISMLARFVAPVRQPKMSDLRPSQVWAGLEDRAYRAWARTVKFYDNLKFVYQIQTTLREWQQQDEERRPASDQKPQEPKTDDRKLPVKSAPTQGATAPGGAPLSNPSGEPH
ncbi:MAG: zf-HC2 domain-containing protein [Acidobacteriia bacterium]|nr:zf-HC2 domain-containing protein [Terriglobia bacterium]